MKTKFRLQLVILVLLNVMFVHITGAVGHEWLLPLYAATLVAPFLVRFHDALWYRLLWNFGVIAIFSILLADATTTGITFLLEDGLILAAFCQVHLVNVIKRQNGADLLFFNSFLIALVTSLFCQDVVFSVVFAVYALVLVVSLHASTLVTARLGTDRATSRRVFRQGVRRAIGALAVTAVVFAFMPRDFRRQGLVSDDLLNPLQSADAAFSEEIRLGQSAARPVQQRIVMRIRVLQGDRHAIPELWRGATLSHYDRNGWQGVHMPQSTTSAASEGGWEDFDSSTVWRRGERHATSSRFRVEFSSPVPKRLFVPLGAHEIRLPRPSYVDPLIDGTLRYDSGGPLSYEVEFANDGFDSNAGVRLASYRYLNRESVPPELGERLAEATRSLGRQPTRREVVQACADYLSAEYRYLLPGERGAARSIDEFLSGQGGGHCEYFATALALMLRMQQIPCRVVTGFRVFEWDEQREDYVVRDAHAHAWVEVWDDDFGWLSADATPAAEATIQEEGWWSRLRERAETAWASLVQFDGAAHSAVLAWCAGIPAALGNAVVAHPAVGSGALATIAGLVLWRRRRRHPRTDRATAEYQAALRRAGVARRANETPRETLDRVATGDLEPRALRQLVAATAAHEARRYANRG